MNDTPTPDVFLMLHDLIALAVNPSACKARLAKLQKLLEQTAAAEARLTERSAKHDQKVAQERAELEERERKVRAREVDVAGKQGRIDASWKILEQVKADLRQRYRDPNIMTDSTLSREPA
jgi:hypothetical protein